MLRRVLAALWRLAAGRTPCLPRGLSAPAPGCGTNPLRAPGPTRPRRKFATGVTLVVGRARDMAL